MTGPKSSTTAAIVWHPGYAVAVVFLISSGLAPRPIVFPGAAVIWSVLMVRRTRIADRFLRPNLPGCREYAERVFFRLLPGFW